MTKFRPVYSDQESKILITMYDNPDMSFDTFSLTQRIYGNTVGSPDFPDRFKQTVKATEQLIVKGLVDGSHLKHNGGLGLYFSDMKFKFKGKQEAIQERDRVEEFKKQLPKIAREADAVVKEMGEAQHKQKK